MKRKITALLSILTVLMLGGCGEKTVDKVNDVSADTTLNEITITEEITEITLSETETADTSETTVNIVSETVQHIETTTIQTEKVPVISETTVETTAENVTETKMTSDTSAKVSEEEQTKENEAVKIPVLTVSNEGISTNNLSWTATDGAESYIIYLLNEETGEFEKYSEVGGISCKDINLEPDTKYTYAVRAVYSDGDLSEMSEPVSIYTCNKRGGFVQGNYIYYSVNDDNGKKHSMARSDRNGKNPERVFSYDDYGVWIMAGEKNFFYESSDKVYCVDYDSGESKCLFCLSDVYDYSHIDTAVYDDMIFVSYTEYSLMETDNDFNMLKVYKSNGDEVNTYNDYYSIEYANANFLYGENGVLYIWWFCSEWEDSEEADGEKICFLSAETFEKTYIHYDIDKGYPKVLGYCGNKAYVSYDNDSSCLFGYYENGQFTEIELGENAYNPQYDFMTGNVYYETAKNNSDESEISELYCKSSNDTYKIADIKSYGYSFCGSIIRYIDINRKTYYFDVATGEYIDIISDF